VIVKDISGEESKYTLDSHGFQIYRHASKEKEFVDDEKIKAEYYPETEQLLKEVYVNHMSHHPLHLQADLSNSTGAVRVYIFDHTIRRQPKDQRSTEPSAQLRGPVQRVHIDQSYSASESRVTYHLPDEAEELLKKRFQIINVSLGLS
jgi:hypothetical protein